jgi:hydroxymethylbilane synthase
MKPLIRIGTRGSKLALYQAELVGGKLKLHFPMLEVETVKIHTKGDMIRRGGIGSIGRGIFTREIEEALLRGEVDIAVHSAKDLETTLPEGLELGAILEREDPSDCLSAGDRKTLKELKPGARIGTSSLRRKAQLKKLRNDLDLFDLRGNIDSRLGKIGQGQCDGIAAAYAGFKRLGLTNFVTEVFDPETFLPQAGQGAVAVEIRRNDSETRELVHSVNHEQSFRSILAERSFLHRLQGGCQIPAGIYSKINGAGIILKGAVFSLDGAREVLDSIAGPVSDGEQLGALLADQILAAGGRKILDEIRSIANE